MASIGFKGGEKMQKILADIARKAGGGELLRVGFLESAKYPDGTNVAQVAYWNEFGTKNAPPRPFFRNTIAAKSSKWGAALGKSLAATAYSTKSAFGLVGTGIADQITQSIVEFSDPANAASTIKKKGFNDPLIDDGTMQRRVEFDIQGGS